MTPQRFTPPRRPEDPAFGDSDGEIAGAVLFPTCGYVNDPQLAARNLQHAAEAHGGRFRFRSAVTAIRRANGRVIGVALADGTEIDAPVVVNVAGPHSAVVNRMAGVEEEMSVRTRPLRQEVAHVPAPPGVDFDRRPLICSDGDVGCYWRSDTGNRLLIGSQEPECDPLEWVDPDDWNRELTEQWTAQVYRAALRIPTLPIPQQAQGIVALYDVSDDWIPIYDRSSLAGFYMAVGTSGNQFKNAPLAGVLMAELILACEAGHDHDREPLKHHRPLYRLRDRPRLLLPPAAGQSREQLLGAGVRRPSVPCVRTPGATLRRAGSARRALRWQAARSCPRRGRVRAEAPCPRTA